MKKLGQHIALSLLLGAVISFSQTAVFASPILSGSIVYDSLDESQYLDLTLQGSGNVSQFCLLIDGVYAPNVKFNGFSTHTSGSQLTINATSLDGCVTLFANAESFQVGPVIKVAEWFPSSGSHSFTLELKDDLGNNYSTTSNLSIMVEPTARLYFLGQQPVGNNLVIQAEYSGSRGNSIDLKSVCLQFGVSKDCLPMSEGIARVDSTALKPGTYEFKLTVIDNFENTKIVSLQYTVPDMPEPTIRIEATSRTESELDVTIDGFLPTHIHSICFYKEGRPFTSFVQSTGTRSGNCARDAFVIYSGRTEANFQARAVLHLDTSSWPDGDNTIGFQILDVFGNPTELLERNLTITKARPTGSIEITPGKYVTTIAGYVSQPNNEPSNRALTWAVRSRGVNLCSGRVNALPADRQEISCKLTKSDLPDGLHTYELQATLNEGQNAVLDTFTFYTEMLNKPELSIGKSLYSEKSKTGELRIGFEGSEPKLHIAKTECILKSGAVIQAVAVLGKEPMMCRFSPDDAPKGRHQITLRTLLLDGSVIMGTAQFVSNLKPIARPSIALSYAPKEWTGRFTAKVTRKEGDLILTRGYWYINGIRAKTIYLQSNSQEFYFDISSKNYRNGRMNVVVNFPDEKVTAEFDTNVSLLKPPPPPPSVKWSKNMSEELYQGQSATVSGVIATTGQLAKSVKIRFQEFGENWGSWKAVAVSKSGFFTTQFSGNTNTQVQLSVDKTGRTPAAKSSTSIKYRSSIEVTTLKRTRVGQDVVFKVYVKPQREFTLQCNANAEVEAADGSTRWLFENNYSTLKTNKNGFATINLGAFEFPHTNVYFICSTNSRAVINTNGSTVANVY